MIEVARYRVIFGDCDPMRIVYYGNYFRLFEIGRAELFRRLGHPFAIYIARGLYLGVIETTCRYRRPSRYDEDLAIHAAVTETRRARITIGYEIRGTDGELRVEGSTTHAVIGEDGRPQRMPEEFRDALRELTESQADAPAGGSGRASTVAGVLPPGA
ncbi:MAG: acyl-CoA thioesterase [Deltaproteobacteria bacterium]|nr:acyl-CoA thioesterase [Deltaproteobacteria bacterium]